ncbi:MAG: VapC toxin family PIN domain ribonuclease [Methylocystis sp.]|nr:MAG: VapC toxin family PIN domain ribonuclease [Methylocystis sp.]
MTPRYLLDANTLFAAASGEAATLSRLSRLSIRDVAVSAIVYGELLAAAAAQGRNARLSENLALIALNLDILPFDRKAADAYGALLRKVEPKRRRALDRMVAAQAIAEGRALVTMTPEEVSDIPGLKLEVWR